MSTQDLDDRSHGLLIPGRRRLLLRARDLAVAGMVAPALPQIAWAAAPKAPAAASLVVMHGFADHTGILLWMQGVRAQRLLVEVTGANGASAPLRTLEAELDARSDFTTTIGMAGLDPGTQHHYVVRQRDNRAVLARGSFKTQTLWQWRTDPPTLRIAAGSCAFLNEPRYDRPGNPYGGGEEIFDTIAAASPDLMLWLGDNLYLNEVDYSSEAGINRRYRYYRNHPAVRKLLTACPNIATWDDHDFGPNDSDGSYSGKGWSRDAFRRYWPLPYSAPEDGIYGKVLQGDVDIFLLDDRFNRYPNRWPEGPDKVMFGARQMLWLKQALTSSNAPFKIIAGGNQFLNKVSTNESWVRFPGEQQEFLRWLADAKIRGVLFLSGDRHFSQMLRVERPGLYPLHELTASPLTAGAYREPPEAERKNPEMVPGSMVNERNFAMLTVSGPRLARELAIELRDAKGAKRFEWRTTAQDLGHPPPRTSTS
jgi:alkaline phosphatase D